MLKGYAEDEDGFEDKDMIFVLNLVTLYCPFCVE